MKSGRRALLSALFYGAWLGTASAAYAPLREYAGASFFDGWDFYGNVDNTTWGNVTYLDRAGATQTSKLAFINTAGNAIIKVDNTTTVADGPVPITRNSVRITTHDTYSVGTLIIIDILHLPYGCSVWPSFWTLGTEKQWPLGGEIDIIEGINMMNNNQMALHTTPGCAQAANPGQSGHTLEGDCSQDRGCIVAETKPNSFGPGFATAGGGVWATQIDVAGVYIWFWSRADIPASISKATSTSNMDTTTWGPPSASYPVSGCNFTEFFTPQQLVLDITLCGTWAGIPSLYSSTCHTPKGSCYADNIIGPGSPTYDNAFFEIPYVRTYAAQPDTVSSSGASTGPLVTGPPIKAPAGTSVGTTSARSSGTSAPVLPAPQSTSGAGRIPGADLGGVSALAALWAFFSAW